jgi:hypothetical protein
MAYAEWYATTIASTTKFGTAGYWQELPDAFPPIIYIKSDTTATNTSNDGLYLETHSTTIKLVTPMKVDEFVTHDKWFRQDTAGSGSHGPKTYKLYYRDITETGKIP